MIKFISRALLVFVLLLVAGFLTFEAAAVLTRPNIATLPPLRDGDLIFQTNPDLQSLAVMEASDTLYTHMGIIKIQKDGAPVVVEVGPVRETPLQVFINRGVGLRVAIARIKSLTPEDAAKALAWAKLQYGKPYDFFFLNDPKRFYCSELVEDAFRDGAGIPLGKYQKVSELKHSVAMDKIIEERWRDYPLCQHDASMTYDKCNKIIQKQELITPVSIARDPRVEMIYSNYPAGK